MSHSSSRINTIAEKYSFTTYLAIGVCEENTCLHISMHHKTAVDPAFRFDIEKHKSPLTSYFPITNEEFFAVDSERINHSPYSVQGRTPFIFDIIFIDGMHTFEQTYQNFVNTIQCSHDKTIWIFDATVPLDELSAFHNKESAQKYRNIFKVCGNQRSGDIFKTIRAIHDFHHEFSYFAPINIGSPRTIIWKTTRKAPRRSVFCSLEKSNSLISFDFLAYAYLLFPAKNKTVLEMSGKELCPEAYKNATDINTLIQRVITTNELPLQ